MFYLLLTNELSFSELKILRRPGLWPFDSFDVRKWESNAFNHLIQQAGYSWSTSSAENEFLLCSLFFLRD